MTQLFEDFLVQLADKGDSSVLEHIDNYLDGHLAQFSDHKFGFGSVATERSRLAVAFRDKARRRELSRLMLEKIVSHGEPSTSKET